MLNNELIKGWFEGYVKDKFKDKHDIRNFLLNHERKELFFNNMCKEIRQVELQPLNFQRSHFKSMVEDMTRLFCLSCLRHKEQLVKNKEAFILEEMAEQARLEKLADDAHEMPEGVIEVDRDHLGYDENGAIKTMG